MVTVCPRVEYDEFGLTAETSGLELLFSLGVSRRLVRVDLRERNVRIEDRVWWFKRRMRLMEFGEITGVTYGYEEALPSFWEARDPIDRFLVGLKLRSGEEVKLFVFTGDGTFTNDGPLPDWFYWQEFLCDYTGTQERDSRAFVKLLSKVLGVAVEPSGLVGE